MRSVKPQEGEVETARRSRRILVVEDDTDAAFMLKTRLESVGYPEALRKSATLASGFLSLDPTLPKRMKYNRRWGLLINAEISR